VAWDGTQFSLTNTPQVRAQLRKAKSRRHQAAWAKITAVVLLELGLHNPLAAAVGWRGESEYALTRELLAALPRQSLLLADRLSGVPALLAQIWDACQALGSHFLIRARNNLLVQKRRRLPDGSALIWVAVRDPLRQRKILRVLQLREIIVRIHRPGHRGEVLRLWTSLLAPAGAPALELAGLYAQRWEQELYWRQMKLELRRSELLQSHTPETAAQEIAMLVLATALLARDPHADAEAAAAVTLSVACDRTGCVGPCRWARRILAPDVAAVLARLSPNRSLPEGPSPSSAGAKAKMRRGAAGWAP